MSSRIKIKKKLNKFTIVPNEVLQSKIISLQAKGLLSQCLSFPDDWNYSINGLVAVVKEGKTAIMNTLKELEHHGYIKRNKLHDDKGRFTGIEYIISDVPFSENKNMDRSQQNQPYAYKPNMVKPNLVKPNLANQTQNNTNNKQINNIKNNIYISIDIINDFINNNNLLYVDGNYFYEYYSQNGWRTSKGEPITNWQNLLITWNNASKQRIEEQQRNQAKVNEHHGYVAGENNIPISQELQPPQTNRENISDFLKTLERNGKSSSVVSNLVNRLSQEKEM